MSSEIYYRKAFIKISENQYLPIIQSGANNCFEISPFGKQLAEKNWYLANYPHKNKYIFTKAEINIIAKNYDKLSIESGGGMKKTRKTSFEAGEFEKWFNAGIKSAKTLEEYISYGNKFSVNDITIWNQPKKFFVNTTKELLDIIEKVEKDSSIKSVSFTFENNRKLYLPLKTDFHKNTIEVDKFFVLVDKTNHNNYFKAKTSRKIIICGNVFVARKFKSEKLAQNYLIKYPIVANFCTIKEINEKCVL